MLTLNSMSYGITQIQEFRQKYSRLKTAICTEDSETYQDMRDNVIVSFLPYGVNQIPLIEKGKYKAALNDNDSYLEVVLYGDIWKDLLPNERLAIEHLYYENPMLTNEDARFYYNMHDYVEARLRGDKELAKHHLRNALWEILHNSPLKATNELERDNARYRRKAQATMLNSPNIPILHIHTPDYIIAPIKQQYQAIPLEKLLPEIIFPLEDNARLIAEEIQQINADIQQQLLGKIIPDQKTSQKSIITDSQTNQDATEAFIKLYLTIIDDGTREFVDKELDKLTKQGKNSEEILEAIEQAIETHQDSAIPRKMDMLATHFNGKLSEVQQREEGYTHYIWHAMDDAKTRPDHAANDGQIFSWDITPPTGHPGHDYNCRC